MRESLILRREFSSRVLSRKNAMKPKDTDIIKIYERIRFDLKLLFLLIYHLISVVESIPVIFNCDDAFRFAF